MIKFKPLILLFFLSACDCYRTVDGVILDSGSGIPVDNVQIVTDVDFAQQQTDHLETSNAEGRFSYADISGGWFGCPDMVLVLYKKGYFTQRITFDSSAKFDTIYLKRTKEKLLRD